MNSRPIIEEFLELNSYYKPEDFNSGGLRALGDFSQVDLMLRENGVSMFCHRESMFDEVIIELHREDDEDLVPLEKPHCEIFALGVQARWELAMYLLSTLTVKGK